MKLTQFKICFTPKDTVQMLAVQKLFTNENLLHALSGATTQRTAMFPELQRRRKNSTTRRQEPANEEMKGSAIALGFLFPLETARTRKQINDDEKCKTTAEMLREILKKEGISGWYQGLLPMISTLWCSNFIYFYTFNGLKSFFYSGKTKPSITMDLSFAIVAAVINVLLTSPMWVANTRLKLRGVKLKGYGKSETQYVDLYSGICDAILKIRKSEGLRALWDGTGPSILLSINPAIQFAAYELLKRYLQVICQTKELSGYLYFMIGAFSKMFATITTYPLQVIQSRLRVGLEKDKSMYAFIKTFLKQIMVNGISSVFCGLEAKLLQTVFTSALMFLIYEKLMLVFKLMGLRTIFMEKHN